MVSIEYNYSNTNRIEDNKLEKIGFIIDMYEEIYNEDFISLTNNE
jgi:hypothetical protein